MHSTAGSFSVAGGAWPLPDLGSREVNEKKYEHEFFFLYNFIFPFALSSHNCTFLSPSTILDSQIVWDELLACSLSLTSTSV